MRISIAMATFNGAKYIQEQLASLSNQSLLPFELVVCDDGSTDGTLSILSEYAKSAPFPVRLHQNEVNLHYTGNFMKAASLCIGDAIAFCDQDDIWDSKKLEACRAGLQREGADLLIHEGRVVDRVGRPTSMKIPDLSALDHVNKAPFGQANKGFAMVMRRQVIAEFLANWDWTEYYEFNRKHGVPLGHDWLLYAWCVDKKQVFFLREELVRYRVHGENATANVRATERGMTRLRGLLRGLATDKEKYSFPAYKWAAEAEFLRNYMRRSGHNPGLEELAEWLRKNSKLWLARSSIYDPQLPRATRWAALTDILVSGGYFSRLEPRLGAPSLCKDLVVASLSLRK